MYSNVFTNSQTKLVTNLGSFAGSPNNILTSFSVPAEYSNGELTKLTLKVGYHFYFDYAGWFSGAFRYNQSLFVLFELPDEVFGSITVQLDSSNSDVATFNIQKNSTLTFNPNQESGFDENKASHFAEIDLMNVNYISGADGTVRDFASLLRSNAVLSLGGGASGFARNYTGGGFASRPASLSNVQVRYWATLEISIANPII